MGGVESGSETTIDLLTYRHADCGITNQTQLSNTMNNTNQIPVLVTCGQASSPGYTGQVLVGLYWLKDKDEADHCVELIRSLLGDKGYEASIPVPKTSSPDDVLWSAQL